MDYAFVSLPIRFNGLVIETTTRCNAKCAMCYQSSGPKGHDTLGIAELRKDVLRRVIADATKIPNMVSRLHIAGGEAFLDEDLVIELVAHGRDQGYRQLSVTTNAYWGSSDARADAVCERLAEAGLTDMEISWDFWHLKYIDPRRVTRVLEAAGRYSIETNLRILVSRRHSYEEALDLLGAGWTNAYQITSGKVFGSGRAATELDPDELYPESVERGDGCADFLNVVVNATGEVFPCCAGMDQTPYPKIGNVYRKRVHEIAERMTNSLWLRRVFFDGIVEVEDMVRDAGGTFAPDEEAGMCTRCWSLFSDEEATAIVKRRGAEIGRELVRRAFGHAEAA